MRAQRHRTANGKVPRIGRLNATALPQTPIPVEAFRRGCVTSLCRDRICSLIPLCEGRRTGSPPWQRSWSASGRRAVAAGTTAIQAAQHATTTIPIVMVRAGRCGAQGFIASPRSLAGNIHSLGPSLQQDLQGKSWRCLIALAAHGLAGGVLMNPANTERPPGARGCNAPPKAAGVQPARAEARRPDDPQHVFAALPREGVHALLILTDALLLNTFPRGCPRRLSAAKPDNPR